jgi:hypothetical protein
MVLNAGVFNVGVLGVSASDTARRFLDWWAARLQHDSQLAVERGVHYEQRWLSLAPSLFDGVHIERSPGTNIGHWSLPDVQLSERDGVPCADGDPIVALRFSGFDETRPTSYSRWAHRLDELELPQLTELVARYAELLRMYGGGDVRSAHYAFEHFADSTPISPGQRDAYGALTASQRAQLGNPFELTESDFDAQIEALVGEDAG